MDAPAPTAAPDEAAAWAQAWSESRRTVRPRRLAAPGPCGEELARIVQAAGAAPDHDRLLPWRFVLVPEAARPRLAAAFEPALVERDPAATGEQREQAREKAFRAPVLLLAVVRLAGEAAEVPDAERLLSLGCAVQNMQLMATALGFASALTRGKALGSRPLRELFALAPDEQAVCFASMGTAAGHKPGQPRPQPDQYLTHLAP